MTVKLRKVKSVDSRFLWKLRNQASVRKESFTSKQIKWSDHQAWFEKMLSNAESQIWIILKSNAPVGQIRFDQSKGKSLAHISIIKKECGKGIGSQALAKAVNRQFKKKTASVTAYIKRSNPGSLRCFEKSGFKLKAKTKHLGIPCYRVEWRQGAKNK